jgi:hypothetical protein
VSGYSAFGNLVSFFGQIRSFVIVSDLQIILLSNTIKLYRPVPVATRSKAYVCGRSPTEIEGSNPTGAMDVCLF